MKLNGEALNATNERNQISLTESLSKASAKIAPLWPLENFVAVNPYLGLTDQSFDQVAQLLSNVGGIKSTLPVSYYMEAINQGRMSSTDIQSALRRQRAPFTKDAQTFLRELTGQDEESSPLSAVQGLADVADAVSGKNWSGFMTDRVSSWASSHFDRGQAQWNAAKVHDSLYSSWRFEAQTDRTPEVMGLKAFRLAIKQLPSQPLEAAKAAIEAMQISPDELDLYLHRLLVRHGGWAAYIAHLDWDAKRYGQEAGALNEFLCVLLGWEYGLLSTLKQPELAAAWDEAKQHIRVLAENPRIERTVWNHLILQEAFDIAAQDRLIEKFNTQAKPQEKSLQIPAFQAVFCIDVRSELFRRKLEMVSPEINTLGFAGFFGFPIKFLPLGHEATEDHCPVLLPAAHTVCEGFDKPAMQEAALRKRRLNRQLSHAWKSFRSGAVSSFGFVSPMGLFYLPKLFTDAFGLTRPVPHPDKKGFGKSNHDNRMMKLEAKSKNSAGFQGISLDTRIHMAKGALTAMSLTEGFARVILIAGHGGTSVNNPHASGLDCGACAGHSGEANARVAADVLNDPEVRKALRTQGIVIPESTLFLAGLHDTTTDEVTLYQRNTIPASHAGDLATLEAILSKAGKAARAERAIRMRIDAWSAVDSSVISRSKDWSQVRPEWGLAGCSAFVAAPRSFSSALNLEAKSFLHSYDWKKDQGFKVLETIMTAPVVVASWISLQYYGSTVENKQYGSGNKALHNVTSGLGVLEGYAGDLRTGLPIQSIHDGSTYQHEPLRLSVVVNAPKEAISNVLEKHTSVKALFDNGWIFLLAMDDEGKISHRYRKNLQWEPVAEHATPGKTIAMTQGKSLETVR